MRSNFAVLLAGGMASAIPVTPWGGDCPSFLLRAANTGTNIDDKYAVVGPTGTEISAFTSDLKAATSFYINSTNNPNSVTHLTS